MNNNYKKIKKLIECLTIFIKNSTNLKSSKYNYNINRINNYNNSNPNKINYFHLNKITTVKFRNKIKLTPSIRKMKITMKFKVSL